MSWEEIPRGIRRAHEMKEKNGVGRGHVKEIEIDPPPLNNILKADAVAKRGNDTRVGMSNWRGEGRDDGKSQVDRRVCQGL
jgi:hypothetical protein